MTIDGTHVCEQFFLRAFQISQRKRRKALRLFVENQYMVPEDLPTKFSSGMRKVTCIAFKTLTIFYL